MSFRRNILASYLGQIYVTLIGIVVVPLYIKYMGVEAYGLVGFFSMLQVWFNLLDMGLTPTIAREAARFRGGATDALHYRRLVQTLESIFVVVAVIGGLALFGASAYITQNWLQVDRLPPTEVTRSIQLMALIVAMRWVSGLYRGAIGGSERLVWLSGFSAIVATLRFVGVLPLLILVGATPTVFFIFQFTVAALELLGLLLYAHRLLPANPDGLRAPWDWSPLKPVLKFSMTIAFTSSVWILVTQTDKLVLSSILPLAEYGYFTLAVLVASVVLVISGPISGALMPRLARLEAQGEHAQLVRVYRQATQLVAVIAGTTSITLAFCAEPLLWAWTGNRTLAHQSAPILILYGLGNGVLAVAAFPYYLQYAKGDLRLHFLGNAAFVVLLIPSIIWAAEHYGAVGAGFVWLAVNLLSFVAWLPLVHRKFEPGLNSRWYMEDVLAIALAASVAGALVSATYPEHDDRWFQFTKVAVTGLLVLLASALASSEVRARMISRLARQ